MAASYSNPLLFFFFLHGLLVLLISPSTIVAESGYFLPFYNRAIGVNYGRVADNLPSPAEAVEKIKSLQAGYVKIYDTNPDVLQALAGTNLQVIVTLPNEQIQNVSRDPAIAQQWIQSNVLSHYPSTLITTIMVGNEVVSPTGDKATWSAVVPAMQNMHAALINAGLSEAIKVSTSLAMDVLATSYPPSAGTFRDEIKEEGMKPLLDFINATKSYVLMDIYPFLAMISNPVNITLDYAMLDNQSSNTTSTDQDTGGAYKNMLDAQFDAVIYAMESLGYPNVNVVIGETGWPTGGDPAATVQNAERYNRGLVQRVLAEPPVGTPRRPGVFIPTFVFALFNEDQKPGPETERNWGLFYPDGTAVYDMGAGLSGGEDAEPAPTQRFSQPTGVQWCVVNGQVQNDEARLQDAMDFACSSGADCVAIETQKECFEPNTLVAHAAYAFNSYWQRNKGAGATCDFHGAAALSHTDPSHGECVFEHV